MIKSSFLNVSITRMNNKLITSLYRKKTFSGVYLNNNSFLPLIYKKGFIHTLYCEHSINVLVTIRFTMNFNI